MAWILCSVWAVPFGYGHGQAMSGQGGSQPERDKFQVNSHQGQQSQNSQPTSTQRKVSNVQKIRSVFFKIKKKCFFRKGTKLLANKNYFIIGR